MMTSTGKVFGMRKLFSTIFIIAIFSSCGNNKKAEKNQNTDINADWLIGSWTRIKDEEESQTYEVWKKVSGGVYEGKGWTMQNSDTVFQEDLRIAKTDSNWNLEVRGVNEKPTFFKIINSSEKSFIAENKQNEFPKKIKYSIEDKKLKAVISDDENEVEFMFKRSID